MKYHHFIQFALHSRVWTTMILLLGISAVLPAQVIQNQSGFGRNYIGDHALSGLVQDMDMVENEDYICTVARIKHDDPNDALDREYLLIRVRQKSNGNENGKVIQLGPQAVASHSFLSVELSHDEDHAIIATSDEVDGLEAVLLLKYSIPFSYIVDQDRMSYDTNVLEDYTGIEIQRRFNPSGIGTGYTLAVGGVSGLKVIVVTELGENLFPNLSRLSTSDLTLTGSDSNDEYMLMCGVGTDDSKIKALRYNSSTKTFDQLTEYNVPFPQRFNDPLIAFNINASTGNRNGFFLAADEYNYLGLLRPIVFRVRSNGTMIWNKALEENTSLRGMYHTDTECEVLTTVHPPQSGYDEYKKYSLDQATGSVISNSSFAASINAYFSRSVKMQEGYQGRPVLLGASTLEPADWVLYKANPANIFGPANFSCPADHEFSVGTRTILLSYWAHNTVNSTHNWDIPAYTTENSASTDYPCYTNKQGLDKEVESQEVTTGTVFPNPVPGQNHAFTVAINSLENSTCELQVTDLLGRTLYRETRQLQPGNNQLQVSTSGISVGVYLVRLVGADALILQERLVIQ